jgi:hypothetical protein
MRKESKIRLILIGMAGGLAGNLTMQALGVLIFSLVGLPLNTSFQIIGDAAGAFFSSIGIPLPGGPWMGALWNNLIGLALGGIWALAVLRWAPLKSGSFGKRILQSILYVEAMSIPMLTLGILSLKMDLTSSALWVGISIIMHLLYGLVLGLTLSYGLTQAVRPGLA